MQKKLLVVLAAAFLVVSLMAVSGTAANPTSNGDVCYLSGPNPDCPNPDCPNPDCPDPDCPHNGPQYRGGK